jgi:CysZ protein
MESPGFWKQIGIGLGSFERAMEYIFQKGFWKYFLISLLVSALVYFGGYHLIDFVSEWIFKWVTAWFGFDSDGWFGSLVNGTLSFLFGFALKILLWYLFFIIHKYIVLMLVSPLLAYISEKVDEEITGNKYTFNAEQLMRDVYRGILISLRNLFIELGFMLLFFFISFIPLIGWMISLVGLFFASAYFYGFAMMDYTNERRRLKISESVAFIRKHKGIAMGNGMVFSFFFLIPWLGPLLAPIFAPVISVIAATCAIDRVVDLKKAYGKAGVEG